MAIKPPPDDSTDADLLFGDDGSNRPREAKRKAPIVPVDGYELEGGGDDDEPAPVPRVAFVPPAPRAKSKSKPKSETTEEPQVDEIWTRTAEWKSTLIVLGIVGAATFLMAYVLLINDQWVSAFFTLLLGAAVAAVLSYPIMITLERPVRITPEQAAKDYYAALSHFLPHYKRMWLLLSTPGRDCPEFRSFPAFRDYWKQRIGRLRADGGKLTGTLAFDVVDFKCDKSAGKTFVDAKFTVVVRPAGDSSVEPLDTVRIDTTFAKGPDNMWYLNSGTLPGRI